MPLVGLGALVSALAPGSTDKGTRLANLDGRRRPTDGSSRPKYEGATHRRRENANKFVQRYLYTVPRRPIWCLVAPVERFIDQI